MPLVRRPPTALAGGSTAINGVITGYLGSYGGGGWGIVTNTNTTANSYAAVFKNANTVAGSITTSGTTTAFNTTSDRRLKHNIKSVEAFYSGKIIDALRPRTFNWVTDGSSDVGFIADEFQQTLPNSVTGMPDQVDEDGNPIHQMIDVSQPELIAYMVAELQSLRQRLRDLGSPEPQEPVVIDVQATEVQSAAPIDISPTMQMAALTDTPIG